MKRPPRPPRPRPRLSLPFIAISVVGLLLICCGVVALTNTPQGTPQIVAVTATLAEGAAAPEPTQEPTETPEPSATPRPTETPRPTADPAVAATREAERLAAAAERAFPCQPGQLKGNRDSRIYHAPGQRDYERTREGVECFDSADAAQAAGYRAAQR
jgi:hypothetical protein